MSDSQERWSMAGQNIDRDKLRAAIRKMGTEYVFLMLNDAITLLPERKLRKLIAQYLNPHEFRPDGARKADLLAEAHRALLRRSGAPCSRYDDRQT